MVYMINLSNLNYFMGKIKFKDLYVVFYNSINLCKRSFRRL